MAKEFLDPLYGRVALPDYAWEIAKAPEVQRLREVRMCNINSLSLMGASAVHRFEHSVGTAALAQENIAASRTRFFPGDSRLLILAALLHDVGSAGFGHSVEYVIHETGFRHDDLLALASVAARPGGYEYKLANHEPIFFGLQRMLSHLLDPSELQRISRLVEGKGTLGPLISGSIDLDNVDNVYRMAYHMGIWNKTSAPLELARSLYVNDTGLRVDSSAVDLIDDWRNVRGDMYKWLLLNEDEFSAKAMLEEALISAAELSDRSFRWSDVDYSLMLKLKDSTPLASQLADRVMTGDLYGCLGVFETIEGAVPTPGSTARDALSAVLSKALKSTRMRRLAGVSIAVHFIQDVNKTDRKVSVRTTGDAIIELGRSSNRTLVGVFAKNVNLSADSTELVQLREGGIGRALERELSKALQTGVRLLPSTNDHGGTLDYFA